MNEKAQPKTSNQESIKPSEKGYTFSLIPQNLNPTYKRNLKFTINVLFGGAFFTLGFYLGHVLFFKENPLFNINYLAELIIALFVGFVGFYYIPFLLRRIEVWLETIIAKTVSAIVSSFWEQQSKKIQEARREKQKTKAKETDQKLKEQILSGVLIDTSVLIDGRILDLVKTGFLSNVLVIPKFVVNELHLLSDGEDSIKRQRARRGLDVVNELKKIAKTVFTDSIGTSTGVDKQLVQFAKSYKMKLMTLDFNLNKVATINGIQVLNINELANAVKTIALPGEIMTVKIIQAGKEKEQGIGYMEDGTMIVVENAKHLIGSDVSVKVTRMIQSNAGKMIFCNLV